MSGFFMRMSPLFITRTTLVVLGMYPTSDELEVSAGHIYRVLDV